MEAAKRRRSSNKQDAQTRSQCKGGAKTKEPKPPHTLEFVNLGSSPKLDEDSKERIRSHAMISFNRRKSEQDFDCTSSDQNSNSLGSGTNPALASSRGRFRLAGTRARPSKKHTDQKQCQSKPPHFQTRLTQDSSSQLYSPLEAPTAQVQTACGSPLDFQDGGSSAALASLGIFQHAQIPIHRLGSRAKDPFDSLPIAVSKREAVLIDYYHPRLLSTPLMKAARTQWLDLAITDSALLNVVLSHSAANFALLQGRHDPHDALAYRTESIRIINKRIDESNGGKLDDVTIGAVASLAGYEAMNGSLISVRTHIDGLEQMVKIRGGLERGGFGSAIRRLILWADLSSANALEAYPRFEPPACLVSNNLEESNTTEVSDDIDRLLPLEDMDRTRNQLDLSALDQRLKSAFRRLRKLSDVLNLDPTTTNLKLKDISYGDEIYLIQREFMSLTMFFDEIKEGGPSSCPIAGLIFVECCLRDVSPSSRIVCDLVARLVCSLEDLEREPRYQAESGILNHLIFWVLFVGAAAAERNTVVREKLVKWLAFVCRRLMQEPWEKIQETLKRVSWIERGGRLVGAPLWEEVTRSQLPH